MVTQVREEFDVGGIRLERPFKIRRLGHFGYYATDMEASMRFYNELLGFQITDVLDFGARASDPKDLEGLGDSRAFFMRYGTDHHAFVLFPWRVCKALDSAGRIRPGAMVNQITWQVGSLREVRNATDWFTEHGIEFNRTGRDLPGSNWHVYPFDPDGRVNELYYGIEQIGWDGLSKPRDMYDQKFMGPPEIPYMREAEEVRIAREGGVDIYAGTNSLEQGDAKYDVGGIMLTRPFKITGIGPVRLFADDMAETLAFYTERLGFAVTETVEWNGQTCYLLRCGTEHHSLGLYPMGLRAEFGLSDQSSTFSFGVRLNDYAQLKAALSYLEENGVEIRYLPPELFPGMDYTAFAIDPTGHAVQLYYYMEQVGWDGKPRPADRRRKVDNADWPDSLEPLSDTFAGEQYMGPWG